MGASLQRLAQQFFFLRFSCVLVTRDGLIERGTTLSLCGPRYTVIHGVCHIFVS